MTGFARIAAAAVLTIVGMASQERQSQAVSEPVGVIASHPRIFLRPTRLRLLQRERERESPRWQVFDRLVTGQTQMPEPGLAYALHYRVAGDGASGKRAIAWALGPGDDLRQLALVYDWCHEALTGEQSKSLTAKILGRMNATRSDNSLPSIRSRALAAIALYDEAPDTPQRELDWITQVWWPENIAGAIRRGSAASLRENGLELMEALHAFRDAANMDLRESARSYFRSLPVERLMSYYPAAFTGPENDFRVPAPSGTADMDWRRAALWRAADLALTAFDTTSTPAQTLQGWLMHDRFIMRGAFGAPYEFLWANPYQPGLSYYNVALTYYNAETGALFVRSGWRDSASWLGCIQGRLYRFENGRPTEGGAAADEPVRLGNAAIYSGARGANLRVRQEHSDGPVFLRGLEPGREYRLEVEGAKPQEVRADPGGVVEIEPVGDKEITIRIR
jgi:hypothetical protein